MSAPTTSAERIADATRARPLYLENGERTDRRTFHAWYETTPNGFKAELIGGEVVVASPLQDRHADSHAVIMWWLGAYAIETKGVAARDNGTVFLTDDSEPQPDAMLIVRSDYGGKTQVNDQGYRIGAPELVVEIANSSGAIDLHRKKDDYERAGVREYVVVLLRDDQVRWLRSSVGRFAEVPPDPDGLFRSGVFPGLWLNPAALLRRDAPALAATLNEGLQSKDHADFVAAMALRRPPTE